VVLILNSWLFPIEDTNDDILEVLLRVWCLQQYYCIKSLSGRQGQFKRQDRLVG